MYTYDDICNYNVRVVRWVGRKAPEELEGEEEDAQPEKHPYIYLSIHPPIHPSMYVCMYLSIYTSMSIYIYIYIHIHTQLYTCDDVCNYNVRVVRWVGREAPEELEGEEEDAQPEKHPLQVLLLM